MSEHERIVQLEAENALLRQALQASQATISRLEARIRELEARLAKDSQNSSKPPSSDGLQRRPRPSRPASRKRTGGQRGHAGHTLALVEVPDVVVRHAPARCAQCQTPLEGLAGLIVERRQVHDLPVRCLEVTEHQVEQVRCPACGTGTRGAFPEEARAPVQYGPRLRAVAVYLNQYQLVPEERTGEALADLFEAAVSDGTIAAWVGQASAHLAPTVARIADLVAAGSHQHADETGIRVEGKLHWLHVNSTRWLTHLAWHRQRGSAATEAIGIWPRFHGWATHDRWASYDAYADCQHSWCVAHLVRDLAFLAEQHHQRWAAELRDLLLTMHQAVEEWRAQGAAQVPLHEQAEWVAQYHELLAQGYAAQAPPPQRRPGQRGRLKQPPARNLLDALTRSADRVLAFLADLRVPFTNNQAERDLRMVKIQQKISGTFRSEEGATAYCRLRSYLGTMRKQGRGMLAALTAVFLGDPLPIAWGS
ncbi:MAG: IS66 family transposase [Ktedonobacterales bacterium]|nr:IS66 family transposase [Ktedonobacterales bacterium]